MSFSAIPLAGSKPDQYAQLLEQARGQRQALETIVRQLAHATPRPGEWEHSWRALQEDALRVLATLEHG